MGALPGVGFKRIRGLGFSAFAGTLALTSAPMIEAATVRYSGGDLAMYGLAVPRPVQADTTMKIGSK